MSNEKKLLTRAEFEEFRLTSAREMAADESLVKDALDVLVRGDKHHWVHQTTWMGEPILNFPQDMFAIQEIIFRTRPKFIIESGVAWGGALLFYSTLMEIIGGERIIGIDIFIPDDLRERIYSHDKLAKRISLINASSIDESTVSQVKSIIGDSKDVMVVLDSYHTHEHVLKELRTYSPFIGKGHYIVCGDTIVDDIPVQEHRPRPWGPGNNPKTAVAAFLKENKRFEVDTDLEAKLLFTCNPGGYLKCTRA